jgi:hypothetical protein
VPNADHQTGMLAGVEKWVQESGFDLELASAHAFMTAGFQVQQSSYFEDPESGDAREIDIVAEDPDPTYLGALRILFVVECKASKKGPWVLFTSSESMTLGNRLMNFAVLSEGGFDAVGANIDQMMARVGWFAKDNDKVAYAFRQAYAKDGTDPAFAASISVAKACKAATARAIEKPPSALIVFPLIVVDAPLVVCALDDGGRVELREIDEFEYVFHGLRDQRMAPCIRVVTRERVEGFAEDARAQAGIIRDVLSGWTESYKRSLVGKPPTD